MPRAEATRKRCAIYTRKSSEEGLEQEFNSLHAQREASEAYIRSQRHEGWVVVPTAYDDGGFSGGNLERPGLQRLLADVRAGRIDVIVTYKVDRLTRSLADFARLIEIFDAHHVSFVSVTQQFNTTTSMGRLTLNVLLSFAQFEREVTGERIRDKIAASKKKGMWMGGNPPLGYDAQERKLIVNPAEADTVRGIFALYLELGCVRRLKETVDRRRWTTKCFMTAAGRIQGGRPFSRGHLYRILSNPLYLGRIAHKGQLHPGQHEALIESETWEAVQAQLAANTAGHRRRAGAMAPSLLAGLLVDSAGERLTPSHAVKNGRRYRYYISRALIAAAGGERKQGWRLPAHDVEDAVIRVIVAALTAPGPLIERLGLRDASAAQTRLVLDRAASVAKTLLQGAPEERVKLATEFIEQVAIDDLAVSIILRKRPLLPETGAPPEASQHDTILVSAPITFRRRGVETKLVLAPSFETQKPARVDAALVKAVARARLWFEQLAAGETLEAIADRESVSARYVSRLLPLAFLAPDIVETILEGRHPADLSTARLTNRLDLPPDWASQRELIGA
jgi:DNA invertase Pin-like site-specific DNA recombinase